MKKVHNPTAACPHRWCKRQHWLMMLATVVGSGIQIASHGLLQFGIFLLVSTLFTVAFVKTIGTLAMDFLDTKRKAVIVDQKWANRAAAVDLLLLLILWSGNVDDALHMHQQLGPVTGARVLFTIVGTVLIGFLWGWPHYRATKPRKPKRVRVWLRSTAGVFGN